MHNAKWGRLRHPHPKGGRAAIIVGSVTALILGAMLLLGTAPANAASPTYSATAMQNADQTVTLTVQGQGLVPHGQCILEFTTAQAAGVGSVSCQPDGNGTFNVSLTTAGAYTASTIQWQLVDGGGDVTDGPFTTDVEPYVQPTPTTTAPTSSSSSPTNTGSSSHTSSSTPPKPSVHETEPCCDTVIVTPTTKSHHGGAGNPGGGSSNNSGTQLASTGAPVGILILSGVLAIVAGASLTYFFRYVRPRYEHHH